MAWNSGSSHVIQNNDIVLMNGWHFDLKFVATGASFYQLPKYPGGIGIGGETYSFTSNGRFAGVCTRAYPKTV